MGMNKAKGAGRQVQGQSSDGTNPEGEGEGRQGEDEGGGVGRQGGHKVEGGRRRAASDTSSSTSSNRGRTSVKDTLEKRRMQVQEGDGERDGDGDNNAITAANNKGNSEDGADSDQDGELAAGSRPDIRARRRKGPEVIVADTGANRPQRTRKPTDIYQAGTKMEVKKPGRGRGVELS